MTKYNAHPYTCMVLEIYRDPNLPPCRVAEFTSHIDAELFCECANQELTLTVGTQPGDTIAYEIIPAFSDANTPVEYYYDQ